MSRLDVAALVTAVATVAFMAGRAFHAHDAGCPECTRLFESAFDAGARDATVDWGEWR